MKVLVVGSGGREHAMAWKLARSSSVSQVFAYTGNPGMAEVATLVTARNAFDAAQQVDADLTVVGPELPLIQGIVDQFRAANRLVVGPPQGAAKLEGSKSFTKEVLRRANVPTADFETVNHLEEALLSLHSFSLPVVLKTDGLAAGKGVIIAHTRQEAEEALHSLAYPVVIEEFLEGEEVSFIGLCDGQHCLPLEATQDHKRAFDNDQGPNTGGMGAYCDGRIITQQQSELVVETIMNPVLRHMASLGHPFTGFLYAGLMMTAQGPKVLEFNVRLGDPEAQALMHRLSTDFGDTLMAAAKRELSGGKLDWHKDPSVCVVLAAEGYPGSVVTGDEIRGIDKADAVVFQAGTRQSHGTLVTAGGRVLGVTAAGSDLPKAIANAYYEVSKIHFRGMHYRHDIGHKGLKRWTTPN